MKTVVITGSTKGIGLGLAKAFLKRGCSVVISGRNQQRLEQEVHGLREEYGKDKVLGQICDVTDIHQVEALWDASKQKFGKVDIWINNAGVTHSTKPLLELDPAEIAPVINTNVIGLIYGSQVALKRMTEQGFDSISDVRGRLSQLNVPNPAEFERSNYIQVLDSFSPGKGVMS